MKFILIYLCLIMLIQNNNVILAEDFISGYEEGNVNSKELVAIEGLEDTYIDKSIPNYNYIVDANGNKIIDIEFREVNDKLSPGDTLLVWYPVGMQDKSLMVLNKDLQVIVPENYYTEPEFLEVNGQIYIKVYSYALDEHHYYDLEGNKLETEPLGSIPVIFDISYSEWARESIEEAIIVGIVPENLQSNYTNKITRKEFCQLAIQTYISKTGNNIDTNLSSPFTDINDFYVTTAYNLKIVSGTGENEFSPDNYITRQEAAVMVNNLAKVLNISNNYSNTEKFVDESYFATWAKDAIYSVSSIKSGDVYVMTGTGDGKFSPWYNYTREQAISTMLRLFNYK